MYSRQLYRQYGCNYVSVVLNNIIGEGDSVDVNKTKFAMGLIVRIVEAKRNNLPSVSVWGTGKVTRSLLYSGDAAEGLTKAAQLYDDPMEVLNIGRDEEVSIADYAYMVKDAAGYEGEILFDHSKPDGASSKLLDNTKLRKVLNWEPPTSIITSVRKVVSWYEENYG